MKKVFRLTPSLHECIWGGNKLVGLGKNTADGVFGESWELSYVPGSESSVDGKKICEVFDRSAWGKNCDGFDAFPVLTKFIDARDKLSVQVHPSDEYALENEGQYGKTEMWYVVGAEEGAGIYMGLRRDATAKEFSEKVADGTVEELLNFVKVKAGQVYFIPAGTVHAIGAGTLIFEIQQNSTLTYRLYDYMRRDKDGNLRELHIDRAMKVADLFEYSAPAFDEGVLGRCKYFETRKIDVNGGTEQVSVGDSYLSLTVVRGEGIVDGEAAKCGDSFFSPAGSGVITLSGDMDVISVTTPGAC